MDPDDASNSDDEGLMESESGLVDTTTDGCGGLCTPGNCVKYARCRTNNDNIAGRDLPTNLTTWAQKKTVCNRQRGDRGCVAMIPSKGSPDNGHAAFVEDGWQGSDGVRRYRLSEASWDYQYSCGVRKGTKAGLNITCFWCP